MADARLKTPPFWLPLPPPETHLTRAEPRSESGPTHLVDFRRSAIGLPTGLAVLKSRGMSAGVAEWQTRDSRPQPSGSPSRPNASDWVSLRGPTPVR
jgi:hypothetical protein